MEVFGSYDVVIAGAGVSGTVAAIRAARQGAKTLLIEGSGVIGGLVTGGRLTKPSGVINGGVFAELLARCADYGAADRSLRSSYWGAYTGSFDAETLQRVILEAIDEAGVEVLLRAQIVGTVMEDRTLRGVEIQTKSGRKLVFAKVSVDASGDGDVAALAGAEFMTGRSADGLTQPMTSYMRILNVDIPALVRDCLEHRSDLRELTLPEEGGERNEDYAMILVATGFAERIEQAKCEGFSWIIPRNDITLKAGLIPGELNVNVTRFHGNALDERVLSRAEIEIRRQAYCAFDFLRQYVKGFERSVFLEVAPKLGVRETRRIRGQYVLTEDDVRGGARFRDAIGLCNAPISYHDPDGEKAVMQSVGPGYGIPLRCLIPLGIEGLFVAGRCISVDEIAFASTRNVPACASTGEAAGAAASLCAATGSSTSAPPIAPVQQTLQQAGVVLGTAEDGDLERILHPESENKTGS
ncbi:FAD-dependent oxidoreductase [Paracidobacterium acidisoli]|uniref:FAD-dependent oxidoreductase n=1 Tax=Paracidobacterium acidisoli TaxID=2303751 RepID=A0A372IUP7_9BACT|nr:FAD-dependent oxidoreductase [Paracidobacterium acidisoli]MBT9330146.1 FAD-dependent oxidoreductase [Paracidobacterium acidisoli]